MKKLFRCSTAAIALTAAASSPACSKSDSPWTIAGAERHHQ